MSSVVVGLFALLVLVQSSVAQEGTSDDPIANPGRPTVSTPATITPVGYLQFETGFLGAWQSPEFSSRESVNEVMKFSVSHRFEFRQPQSHSSTTLLTIKSRTERQKSSLEFRGSCITVKAHSLRLQ